MIVKTMTYILPVLLGSIAGYLYYSYIGCNNGCAITGNPLTSTVYGAAVGAVFVNWRELFNVLRKNDKDKI